MSRKAFVSSSMSVDEALIEAGQECALAPLVWPFLVTYFDDWGRAEASPVKIKAQVFPLFDAVSIQCVREALDALAAAGVILLYESGGKRYMAVDPVKWFKYQTHIRGEKRTGDGSQIPCPEEHRQWWATAASQPVAPVAQDDAERAQVRAPARSRAQSREITHPRARFSPSPSPSVPEDTPKPPQAPPAPTATESAVVGEPTEGKPEPAPTPPWPVAVQEALSKCPPHWEPHLRILVETTEIRATVAQFALGMIRKWRSGEDPPPPPAAPPPPRRDLRPAPPTLRPIRPDAPILTMDPNLRRRLMLEAAADEETPPCNPS